MMTPSVSERSTDWNIKWVTCCSTGGWAQQRNQIQSSVNTLRHLEVHIWLCWCSSWWWKSSQEVRIPDLQAAHVRGTPRLGGSQLQRTVENGGRSHDSSEDERYYKVHRTVNDFKNTNNHTHQFRQNAALQRWGQRICAVQQGQWLQYGGEVSAHIWDFDLEPIMLQMSSWEGLHGGMSEELDGETGVRGGCQRGISQWAKSLQRNRDQTDQIQEGMHGLQLQYICPLIWDLSSGQVYRERHSYRPSSGQQR